jgi:predicted DNA-binding transcriptional regulator YafY
MRQVVRQLDILRTLQARRFGTPISWLVEEYGYVKRTIERDLGDLRQAGFILRSETRDDQQKYWFLDKDPNLPMNLPVLELAAMIFADKAGMGMIGTPFGEHLRSAVRRFTQTMSDEKREFLERAADAYVPLARGQKSYEDAKEILEQLNTAMLERRVCSVTYRPPQSEEARTYAIEPLRFLQHRGGLYVISRMPRYDQLITQAVDRFVSVEVGEERFEIPEHLSIEDRLEDAFGISYEEPMDVVVRFSKEQAPYVRERTWHPSQELEELEDGRVVLRMRAGGLYEIRSWVLSFGASAEVLGPEELRAAVVEELQGALVMNGEGAT